MKRATSRGFTLIELLVVIAIIAILAAILFPVFAQAKVAAKKTSIISNGKQMGLAMLMYANDYDDVFSPVAGFRGGWNLPSFIDLTQPYIKNVGIVMDPFTPASINSNPLVLNSQWAMPPRRGASVNCPTDPTSTAGCAFGLYNSLTRAQITGGARWIRDGIGGVWKDTSQPQFWHSYGYRDSYPSMSQTQIGRVADTMMITQGYHFDMMWAMDWNPDECYRYWGDGVFNLFGDQNMNTGPAGRIGATGRKAGVYPTNVFALTEWPEGLVVSVYADGHARSQKWLALHSKSVDGPGGTKYLAYAAPEVP